MKKRILWIALLAMVLLSIQFPRAAALLTRCSLSVELVNQDPYPANPGEYVKVVFQINGLNNPDCDKVSFELKENFPEYFKKESVEESDESEEEKPKEKGKKELSEDEIRDLIFKR